MTDTAPSTTAPADREPDPGPAHALAEGGADIAEAQRLAHDLPPFRTEQEGRDYISSVTAFVEVFLPEVQRAIDNASIVEVRRAEGRRLLDSVRDTMTEGPDRGIDEASYRADEVAMALRQIIMFLASVWGWRQCTWCRFLGADVELVRSIHSASGSGYSLNACESCQKERDLTPVGRRTAHLYCP